MIWDGPLARDNINTCAMSSSETTSLLGKNHSGDPEWVQNWVRNDNNHQTANRPRPSPRNENNPLLPPMPQSSMPPAPSSSKAHNRSRSEFAFPTESDPSHPFNRGGGQRPPPSGNRHRSRPPSRNAAAPMPVPAIPGSAPMPKKPSIHRRAKSDVHLLAVGGSGTVTKADLLKNFPNPRWGGPSALSTSQHGHRTRTSSSDGGPLLVAGAADGASIASGYGSTAGGQAHPLLNTSTIGSVTINEGAKRSIRHTRAMSDVSIQSVTTNMAKSALFRGVTAKGTLQLQLPKDAFRVLIDSQLEAGCVYKRKLVDNEDEVFVDYHTVEEGHPLEHSACVCTCANCQRCNEKVKRLPPDLYVMAVDNTLYRRILDEIIDSETMPCGTYFCGHHEDVRHPDVKIAAAIVFVVFLLLLAGAVIIRD